MSECETLKVLTNFVVSENPREGVTKWRTLRGFRTLCVKLPREGVLNEMINLKEYAPNYKRSNLNLISSVINSFEGEATYY